MTWLLRLGKSIYFIESEKFESLLSLNGTQASKWNRELIPPTSVHSNTAAYESAKKEIELSLLENRDSILSAFKYPVLIYRYTTDNCNSCITEDLSELNILQDEVVKGRITNFPISSTNQ